jgi:hypothetical protein
MKKSTSFLFVCCATLLSEALPGTVKSQSTASTASSASFKGTKPKAAVANEVTVTATIQQVLPKGARGNSNLRLLVSAPQGVFNADLGPYLASDVKESLTAGAHVQLAGTMQTIQGQNYLMARELTLANRQITIRNENGFLVRTKSDKATQMRQNTTTTTGDLQ